MNLLGNFFSRFKRGVIGGGAPNSSFELNELTKEDVSLTDQVIYSDVSDNNILKRDDAQNISKLVEATTNVLPYDGSKQYVVGDLVRWYNDQNFVCTQDTTGATFDWENSWVPANGRLDTGLIRGGITQTITGVDLETNGATTLAELHFDVSPNYAVNDVLAVFTDDETYEDDGVLVTAVENSGTLVKYLTTSVEPNVTRQCSVFNYSRYNTEDAEGFIVTNVRGDDNELMPARARPISVVGEMGYQFPAGVPANEAEVFIDPTLNPPNYNARAIVNAVLKTSYDSLIIGGLVGDAPSQLVFLMSNFPDIGYKRTISQRLDTNLQGAKIFPGGMISPGSANLTIDLGRGQVMFPGGYYDIDQEYPDNWVYEDRFPYPDDFTFFHIHSTSADLSSAEALILTNSLDVDNYNPTSGGQAFTVAAIDQTVGEPQFQIWRVYTNGLFFAVYYGHNLYHSITEARSNLDSDSFTESEISKVLAFRGHIITKAGLTSWVPAEEGINWFFIAKPEEYSLDRGNPQFRGLGFTQNRINSEAANNSSGWLLGGELVPGTNPSTTVTIQSGTTQITDSTVTPAVTTVTSFDEEDVTFTTQEMTDHTIATISKDSTGTTVIDYDDAAIFTASNDRTKAKLGIVRFGVSNTIRSISNTKTPLTAPVLTGKDFSDKFINDGVAIIAADPTVDLSLDLDGGKITGWGINASTNENSPNVKTINNVSDVSFRLVTSLGETTGTLVTDMDITQIENISTPGTFTNISPNNYSVKRTWQEIGTGILSMQYGQAQYDNNEISSREYELEFPTPPPYFTETHIVLNTILIKENSTVFNNDQNQILSGDQTGGGSTSTSSGGSSGGMDTNMENMSNTQPPESLHMNTHAVDELGYLSIGPAMSQGTTGAVRLPLDGLITWGNGTDALTNVQVSIDNTRSFKCFLNNNDGNFRFDLINGQMIWNSPLNIWDFKMTGNVLANITRATSNTFIDSRFHFYTPLNIHEKQIENILNSQYIQTVITPAASITLNMDNSEYQTLTVSQDTTFNSITNPAINNTKTKEKRVKLTGSSNIHTLTFPNDWIFLGAPPPVSINPNKTAFLSITSYGTNDSDVVAVYSEEI